jgi:hypothetical protein
MIDRPENSALAHRSHRLGDVDRLGALDLPDAGGLRGANDCPDGMILRGTIGLPYVNRSETSEIPAVSDHDGMNVRLVLYGRRDVHDHRDMSDRRDIPDRRSGHGPAEASDLFGTSNPRRALDDPHHGGHGPAEVRDLAETSDLRRALDGPRKSDPRAVGDRLYVGSDPPKSDRMALLQLAQPDLVAPKDDASKNEFC